MSHDFHHKFFIDFLRHNFFDIIEKSHRFLGVSIFWPSFVMIGKNCGFLINSIFFGSVRICLCMLVPLSFREKILWKETRGFELLILTSVYQGQPRPQGYNIPRIQNRGCVNISRNTERTLQCTVYIFLSLWYIFVKMNEHADLRMSKSLLKL